MMVQGVCDLGDNKLVKETLYVAKLTVASNSNLELLTGDVFMSDGSETPATQTPYKLVTTDIESVDLVKLLLTPVSMVAPHKPVTGTVTVTLTRYTFLAIARISLSLYGPNGYLEKVAQTQVLVKRLMTSHHYWLPYVTSIQGLAQLAQVTDRSHFNGSGTNVATLALNNFVN